MQCQLCKQVSTLLVLCQHHSNWSPVVKKKTVEHIYYNFEVTVLMDYSPLHLKREILHFLLDYIDLPGPIYSINIQSNRYNALQ